MEIRKTFEGTSVPNELEIKGYSSDLIDHEHPDNNKNPFSTGPQHFYGAQGPGSRLISKTTRERENQHGGVWTHNTANPEYCTYDIVG